MEPKRSRRGPRQQKFLKKNKKQRLGLNNNDININSLNSNNSLAGRNRNYENLNISTARVEHLIVATLNIDGLRDKELTVQALL
jgi:hypothetical protein